MGGVTDSLETCEIGDERNKRRAKYQRRDEKKKKKKKTKGKGKQITGEGGGEKR